MQFASADEHLSGHIPIYIYDRLDEPTRSMLEENLAYAQGGEICVTFATGMAGISAALGAALRQGQEVVSHRIVYGCTYSLMTNWLPRFGMNVRFADFLKPESLAAEITPATRVLYFETPINPTLELIDIAAIRRVADQANAGREEKDRVLVIVDNTFATPFCQKPLRLGADLVVESLTKGLGGFGTDMGGAVIAAKEWYNLDHAVSQGFRRRAFAAQRLGSAGVRPADAGDAHDQHAEDRAARGRIPRQSIPKWRASVTRAPRALRRRRWPSGRCSIPTANSPPAA